MRVKPAVGDHPYGRHMSRVVYYTACTLDGFIADENDSLDWLFEVPHAEDDGGWDAFIDRIGPLVMGATTYLWAHEHHYAEHPEQWQEHYGDRPAWVFTHRDLPEIPGADIHVVSGDVKRVYDDELLAAADGKDVWVVGGGDLVGQFDDAGLLDEIEVHMTPVVLGAGRPLLPRRITSSRLRFREGGLNGQRCNLTLDVLRRDQA
jgi:dihydrofolate reductase